MLTLEEYEKLNPRCEITHQGTRLVRETSMRCDLLLYDIKVQNPPELKQQASAASKPATSPVSNFTF